MGAVCVCVVGLLATAGIGLGTRGDTGLPLTWGTGATDWLVFAAASVGWVAAVAAVLLRTSPRPNGRRALRQALLLQAVLTVLAVLLLTRTRPSVGVDPDRLVDPEGFTPLPGLRLPGVPILGEVVVGLLTLGLLGGLLLALWGLWDARGRLFRRRGRRLRDPRYGRGARLAAEVETLLDAVRRSRHALAGDQDARRRIIAAYAALEAVIAERGPRREASQTPTEFLLAAVSAHVLGSEPEVTDLLTLFHQARFSHEPMPGDALTRAEGCLAVLEQDLETALVPS
ncbi:MAG: DUF4129 domain-containing protein [Nocardioidaceae bacterium]